MIVITWKNGVDRASEEARIEAKTIHALLNAASKEIDYVKQELLDLRACLRDLDKFSRETHTSHLLIVSRLEEIDRHVLLLSGSSNDVY